MRSTVTISYQTNTGSNGSFPLPIDQTIHDVKSQLSSLLSLPIDSFTLLLPKHKNISSDQSLRSFNQSELSFQVSTEISELPIRDYFAQLQKKLNAKDVDSFKEILEEWEESLDLFSLVNSENAEGWTLMHFACYKGAETIVACLVEKLAICNSESDDSWTPLQLACYNGNTGCVKALLHHPQLQINRSTNRGTALHQASRKGQADILHLLLQAGACMTIEDSNGLIPLQVASSQEVFEIIPQYMGERLIRSLTREVNSCCELNAKVLIENKDILMLTSLTDGSLGLYEKKNPDSSEYKKEFKVLNLYDIYDIREISPTLCCLQGRFGTIEFRNNSCREVANQLSALINYCHMHKIGYSEDNQPNISLVMSNIPSRTVSFNRVSLSSFSITNKLWENPYCKFYSVSSRDSAHSFLMKQVPKAEIQSLNKTHYFVQESKLLQQIRHSFISRLIYTFQSKNNLYFIFEYCKNNLVMSNCPMNLSTAKNLIAQVIAALEYLHSRDIAYRNLSPANIWQDNLGNIKLLNFETARENVNYSNKAKSFVGTLGFVAPECFFKDGHEKPADIYALGPCLFYMLTGEALFKADDVRGLVNAIKLGQFSIPKSFPGEVQDFIGKVMQKDPNLRPNIATVKKQAWLKDVNWNDLGKKRTTGRKSILITAADIEEGKERENFVIEEDETDILYDEIEDFDYYGGLNQ
jgi:ankyrin repeat protein